MSVLFGTFKKQVFFNPAYNVATFYLEPSKDMNVDPSYLSDRGHVKCHGKLGLTQKNMPLFLEGEWKPDDYGVTFRFTNAEAMCSSPESAEDFLGEIGESCLLKKKDARKIVSVTGANLFEASLIPEIEDKICSKKKVDEVAVALAFSKVRRLANEMKLAKILDGYKQGSYDVVQRIMRKFPDDALEVIKTDPYRLYVEANVGFKLVDQLALANNVQPLSEDRIRAITLECLRRETASGNVYMNLTDLCKSAKRIEPTLPAPAIVAALKEHPYVVKDEEFDIYYEKRMLEDETKAAKEFARIMNTRKDLAFRPEIIDVVEKENGRAFGNQQRSAFQLLTTTGFKLLTGDPGTGKTTTLNGLLRYLELTWKDQFGVEPKFALCAPSGRASQRMKETTKRNALTVHKLLEYQPYGNGEYFKDGNDPIDADVVVVDEVSMLGLSTFSKLVAAIKSGSMVILIGDTNQLQSVEPGSVLADIISTKAIDRCNLTEVFRQAAESLINVNAKKIIRGEQDLKTGPDFELIQAPKERFPEVLIETAERLIEEAGNPNRVQCLAPVRKGTCGITQGNLMLQDLFNPGKGQAYVGSVSYRLGDRVIMGTNNYALNYFNGDVGYIREITDMGMKIEIGEETIKLPKEQYQDMNLAYNCTIHKSQGSEYDYLIIILQEDAGGMLDQNLFYTGVTRGKKKVVVVYEGDTVTTAIRTKNSGRRNSLLAYRILEAMDEGKKSDAA